VCISVESDVAVSEMYKVYHAACDCGVARRRPNRHVTDFGTEAGLEGLYCAVEVVSIVEASVEAAGDGGDGGSEGL
jgi:hypothetical protein